MNDSTMLTAEETATLLEVAPADVKAWAQRGTLVGNRGPQGWMFSQEYVELWRRQQETVPGPLGLEPVTLGKVLAPERVLLLDVESKTEALQALIDALATSPQVHDAGELEREMYEREQLMSTGIGFGIGVPHVRLASVEGLVLAVGVTTGELTDYLSLDEQPVRIVCMMAANEFQHALYLRTLAAISSRLKKELLRARLLHARNPRRIYELLSRQAEHPQV
jgi:PTS system nitrogen regulatory IIA component